MIMEKMKVLNQLDYTNNDFFIRNLDVKIVELLNQNQIFSEVSNNNKSTNKHENTELINKQRSKCNKEVLSKLDDNNFNSKKFEQDRITNYNREFRDSNIKDIKFKDINKLNNINSSYNEYTSLSQLNSTNETDDLNKYSKSSNLKKENFENVSQDKEDKEATKLETAFSTKMIFSNPNFKQSSKFFTNGINIENRKESKNDNLKFTTIKKYEKNLLNLSNQNTFTINESKNYDNNVDKISKTLDKYMKRNHASNNKYVISQAYHTNDKYLDNKTYDECYNCKLKEKINKKFDFQFKEKFKVYDNVVNTIILEVKNLMKKENFSNLTKAYNLIKQYFKCKLGTKEAQHSDLFYLLGEVCRKLNFEKEAEINLLEALRYEDHPTKCYLSLGLLYLNDTNLYDVSIKMLEKYNSLVKNNHFSYYILATAYLKINDFKSSLKNIDIALKLLESSVEISTNQEYIEKYMKVKREVESIDDI